MIKIGSAKGFLTAELQQLEQAVDKANAILISPEFSEAVLGFQGSNGSGFANTKDGPTQVLAKLLSQNWVVPFSIRNFSWWVNHFVRTIAEENPDGSIVFNRYYYDSMSLSDHVDTVIHEVCHAAGYSHRFPSQWDSVPYALGDLARELCI